MTTVEINVGGKLHPVEAAPDSRTFRDAWVSEGAEIVVDMEVAREIQRDRIRERRAPILAALDVDYMRADEIGDEAQKAQIVAQKNVLRNITQDERIKAASTIEELSALTLSVLTQSS